MRFAKVYAWCTISVLLLIAWGDFYDFTHGGILESKGTVGTACGIVGWLWFFLSIAAVPILIMQKGTIRAALGYIITMPVLSAVWLLALFPQKTPLLVPSWLYMFDVAVNCALIAFCIFNIFAPKQEEKVGTKNSDRLD